MSTPATSARVAQVWLGRTGARCGLSDVPFPRPARRTGRACSHASGSPRVHVVGSMRRCRVCSPMAWRCCLPLVSVAGDRHRCGVEQRRPRPPSATTSGGSGAGATSSCRRCLRRSHRITRCQVNAEVAEGRLGHPVPEVGGPAPQHRIELAQQDRERLVVSRRVIARTLALTSRQAPSSTARCRRRACRASLPVPLDAEPEEVEALVDVADPRLRLRQAQAHRRQYRRDLFSQGFGVRLGARHQDHEVVRIADEPVGGQPLPASLARAGGECPRLPRPRRSARRATDRAMLASSGERIPPWGVPVVVFR